MRILLAITAFLLTSLLHGNMTLSISTVVAQPEQRNSKTLYPISVSEKSFFVKGEILLQVKEQRLLPIPAYKVGWAPKKRKSAQQKRRKVLTNRRRQLIEFGAKLGEEYGVQILRVLPLTGILHMKVPEGKSEVGLKKKIEKEKSDTVEYVVLNTKGEPSSHIIAPGPHNPNDRFWSEHQNIGAIEVPKLWGLKKIGMQQAWTDITGGDTIVAVIGSGIDTTHPDFILQDGTKNLWTNYGEFSKTPNQDDDENCFVDDIHGANMYAPLAPHCQSNLVLNLMTKIHIPNLWGNKTNSCMYEQIQGDISDEVGHETEMAGIIGGGGNNGLDDNQTVGVDESIHKGVVGVNWKVKLMGIKSVCIKKGNTSQRAKKMSLHTEMGSEIDGIEYAIAMGAHIINFSYTKKKCQDPDDPDKDCDESQLEEYKEQMKPLGKAIERADEAGILFVASAGNGGTNNAEDHRYPANFVLDNLISVAATGINFDIYPEDGCIDADDKKMDCLSQDSNYNDNGFWPLSDPRIHIAAPGFWILTNYPPTLPKMPIGKMKSVPCNEPACMCGGNPCVDPEGLYVRPSGGTSAAAALVSGCAALLQSMRMSLNLSLLSPQDLKNIILGSADRPRRGLDNTLLLAGQVLLERRLNCHKAIHMLPVCSSCMGPADDPPEDVGVSP